MNTIEKHKKLLHSLRAYLIQEYPKDKWITTDKDTYDYFAQQAFKSAQKAKTTTTSTVPTAQAAPQARPVPAALPTPKAEQAPTTVTDPVHLPAPTAQPLPEQVKPISPPPTDPTPRLKTHLEQKQVLRETLPPIAPTDFTEMLAFFKEKLPSIPLSDAIPDDSEAIAFTLRWKAPATQVLLLSFSNLPKEQQFLANVAQAIDQRLASAKIVSAFKVEEEKGWGELLNASTLRLVISSNNSLHTLPELMKYYREESTGKHTLGRAPLFLLADLSLYIEQPALKASLWKALCQCLGSK